MRKRSPLRRPVALALTPLLALTLVPFDTSPAEARGIKFRTYSSTRSAHVNRADDDTRGRGFGVRIYGFGSGSQRRALARGRQDPGCSCRRRGARPRRARRGGCRPAGCAGRPHAGPRRRDDEIRERRDVCRGLLSKPVPLSLQPGYAIARPQPAGCRRLRASPDRQKMSPVAARGSFAQRARRG